MSEYEDYIDEDQQDQRRNPLRDRIKELEAETKALRAERDSVLSAKRELAFVKAGVDPSDPAAKYFVKGYDGELDPEAIKQAAIEARLMSPPEKSDPQAEAEKQAWGRTNEAASGAGSPSEVPDIHTRINNAKSQDEVLRILAEAEDH